MLGELRRAAIPGQELAAAWLRRACSWDLDCALREDLVRILCTIGCKLMMPDAKAGLGQVGS